MSEPSEPTRWRQHGVRVVVNLDLAPADAPEAVRWVDDLHGG
jgi:hypothetical protein